MMREWKVADAGHKVPRDFLEDDKKRPRSLASYLPSFLLT